MNGKIVVIGVLVCCVFNRKICGQLGWPDVLAYQRKLDVNLSRMLVHPPHSPDSRMEYIRFIIANSDL